MKSRYRAFEYTMTSGRNSTYSARTRLASLLSIIEKSLDVMLLWNETI